MMDKIYRGRLQDLPQKPSRLVKVVFSCTKSDSEHERQVILQNAVPEIQTHCQQFGLEFQLVDMHQGPIDVATNDHEMGALRLSEIEDAHRISEGPFFVSFIGNKYGEYVLPIRISGNEFTHIRDCAFEAGKDINVLDEWYSQEGEGDNQFYVLQPISTKLDHYYDLNPENSELHEKDVNKWKKIHDSILEILQQCAEYVHDEGLLNEEQLHKYHVSALEDELSHALLLSDGAKDRCFCVFRNFEDLPQNVESQEMHNYVDIRKPNRPKIYKKAQERIKLLKESKIPSAVPQDNILHFSIPWRSNGICPDECEEHEQYLKEFCSQFVLSMKQAIDQYLLKEGQNQNSFQRENPLLYRESLAHLQFASEKCANFVSRDSIVDQVEKQVCQQAKDSDSKNHVVILHGEPGSGKTSVMAQLVKLAPKWLGESAVIIPRFIGATSCCLTLRDALESICMQILEVYELEDPPMKSIPGNFDKLTTYFRQLIEKLDAGQRPILIAIDLPFNITETLNKDQLRWIPDSLPESTSMILSLSECTALKELNDVIEAEPCIIRVTSLNDRELSDMVTLFLKDNTRLLSQDQTKIVKRAVARNPLPAFAKLLSRETQFMYPSGNGREPVATTIDAANLLFQHIEDRHGAILATHVLRYITAARFGLTELELQDLLSCDDELLTMVYPYQLPGVLRFPHRLWTAMRRDLGPMLKETSKDHRTVLTWSESVLAKVAEQRYLATPSLKQSTHRRIAAYFMEEFLDGKTWEIERSEANEVKGSVISRMVAAQPLLFGKTKNNLRRITELWHHLTLCGEINKLKSQTVCNFEYLLAAVQATSVQHVIQDINEIRNVILDSEMDLIQSTLSLSADALTFDPMQLAAELIGRLLPRKGTSPQLLGPLINQALSWCDEFTKPLLVPLYPWLPVPVNPIITTFKVQGHISEIKISSDNQRLYCLVDNFAISVYQLASQKKIWQEFISDHLVTCFDLARNHQFLAVGLNKPGLIMCSMETGKRLHNFEEQEGAITCLVISHDSKRVVTGSKDAMIRVFDVEKKVMEQSWRGSAEMMVAVALNSHDDVLITASADCMIRTWSLESFSLLDAMDGQASPISKMIISADDNFILTAYEDGKLQITCLATGTEIYCLEAHKDKIKDFSIAPESSHITVVTNNNILHLYDISNGTITQSFSPHGSKTEGVQISHDGHFIVTASSTGEVKLWTTPRKNQGDYEMGKHHDKVTCIAMSKDCNFAIAGSADCTMKLWSLELCQVTHTFSDHEKPITCLALADNGSFAVSGSEDKTVRVWSTVSGVVVVCFSDHQDTISQVLITSDNKRILSADFSNYMKLWKAESGEVLLSCMGPSAMVVLSPDNNFAISGDCNELMKVWSVGSGESVKTINHVQNITCITVTKDGQFTITGSEDMSLKIWETQTGKLTQVLVGHEERVSCVATADNNRHVASGSDDKDLIIWTMATGEIEKTLKGHTAPVTSVKLTGDGSALISGSMDGTLRVWSLPSGTILTTYYMNIPVMCFQMSFDGGYILVQLGQGGSSPLLRLHNSPAVEVNSQSQVEVDINEDTTSALSVRPPLLQKQTSLQLSNLSNRKSTASAPEVARIKPMIQAGGSKGRNQSYSDISNRESGGKSHKKKQNGKSGVCAIF